MWYLVLLLAFGGGGLFFATQYRKNKDLRNAAELEEAERLGPDAVKTIMLGRMAKEARAIKAIAYSFLVASAVVAARYALGFGLYYGNSEVHLVVEPFLIPFVPTLLVLLFLVYNTDFLALSEHEEAKLLRKYYTKQGLTEDGLTYEEAARRQKAEEARKLLEAQAEAEAAKARAETARIEADGRAAYEARKTEEARKTTAEAEAKAAIAKTEAEAEAARLSAAEAERRRLEEEEAAERAFWASPEGRRVRAAQMEAEIRTKELQNAAVIAAQSAEYQAEIRKRELDALKEPSQ